MDAQVRNYRDWGIPLGRRFRALKLWCLLRAEGMARLRERLRRDLNHARRLAERIAQEPGWKVLNPVLLQTICVRHEPPGLTAEDLDRHTRAWCDTIVRSGQAYLTPARLDDRWMVRISIGAEATEWPHIEQLWKTMRSAVSSTCP